MPYTFLPDTSVIYNRKIIDLIQNETLQEYVPIEKERVTEVEKLTIILSRIMLAEVENQANQTKPQENVGLEVLQELYALSKRE